jgi:3-oxoacyl-[acyl-carrier-protein] synthase I
MSDAPIGVLATGLVTSVGFSASSSCAAIRANISNPTETRLIDSSGAWIMAHQVPFNEPWRGLTKLTNMAAIAIREALAEVPRSEWSSIPLLLCVAEKERPGRDNRVDDRLIADLQNVLEVSFAPGSSIITEGRVGIAVAIAQARALIEPRSRSRVLVGAADSLLSWPTLSHYERSQRLLTKRNSNGFMPGEGAGALLLGTPTSAALLCTGLGFAMEEAAIETEQPLRADGLTKAISAALVDAGVQIHDMDYRISDVSGEQYYFKEAALAMTRVLRHRKDEFDLWHPAECIGETGSVSGAAIVAVAEAACRKGYGNGSAILAHFANDAGRRAALTLQYRSA